MSLICSRERTSDGEEGASLYVGVDHFEELSIRRPCGDKNVV